MSWRALHLVAAGLLLLVLIIVVSILYDIVRSWFD